MELHIRNVSKIRVEDHPHIAYGKAAVGMYTLRGLIGEDAVNTALRHLLDKYAFGPACSRPRRARDSARRSTCRRHRIHSGKQTIHITAPREPARGGVDPWRKLIEREREDEVVGVKTVEAGDAQ